MSKDIKAHVETDSEYAKRVSKIDMDDMYVCDYCGSEEVDEKAWVNMNTLKITSPDSDTIFWCNNCDDEASPMTYFEWQEKIAEECGGNKDKYDEIMDGSRM